MIIDSKNKSLKIKLDDTPTTELIWNVSYIDTIIPQSKDGVTDGTNAVTLVSGIPITQAPPQNTNRRIQDISIFNADNSTQTVTVYLLNASAEEIIISILLGVGFTLHYEINNGWYVTNATGSIETVIISESAIEIGQEVIGGVPDKYLYVDPDGLLAQGWLSQDTNGLLIEDGKYFSSANGNIQMDFGSGISFTINTDADVYSTGYFAISPDIGILKTPTGLFQTGGGIPLDSTNKVFIAAAETLLKHDTKIEFDSPIYNFSQLSASTVPVLDASKNIISSGVSLTTLGFLDATSSIQTQLDAKLTSTLANTKIFIGSAGNLAVAQSLSLDASAGAFSLSNAGVLTMPDAAVATRGLLNATDWGIFNSKQAGDATLTALAGLTITANSLIYGTGADAFAILAQNTTATRKFLMEVSSSAPVWDTLVAGDIPDISATYLTVTAAAAAYQPLDTDLTSWAGVTRASDFDTFVATPSSANLASLVTDETGYSSGALLVFNTAPLFRTEIDLNNPANTFKYAITPAAILADRIINLPLTTQTETIALVPTIVQSIGNNPTGTASATKVMMGLAVAFTPRLNGTVRFICSGLFANNTASDGGQWFLKYGTGTAPTNGAATTGTNIGSQVTATSAIAGQLIPWERTLTVTGLVVGTTYWFDLSLNRFTGGTATFTNVDVEISE